MGLFGDVAVGNQAGFTPVRRRQSTLNPGRLQADPEKEWTAARCNRLLRTLTSRVALLKKDISHLQAAASQGPVKTARKRSCTSSLAGDDDEFNPKKKQIKRTYAGRGAKHTNVSRVGALARERRQFVPGAISVPTPILSRVRGDILCTENTVPLQLVVELVDQGGNRPKGRSKEADTQHQLCESMRQLKRSTPAPRYSIYEGIYTGLEALLKATTLDDPPEDRKGSKSLLSMCLGMVPAYIADEQKAWEKELRNTERRIDSREISTEIYDDLENLGTANRGWKHLRVVVRSHGVQVVSNAMRAGLLDLPFCGILIKLCVHNKASTDGERLLESLLSCTRFSPPKSVYSRFEDETTTRPLHFLLIFADQGGSPAFQYRQLSNMLDDDRLPPSWLATKEFSPIWTKVIEKLSSQPVDISILKFADVALRKLATLHQQDEYRQGIDILSEPAKQTFTSLLTTISSIAILNFETSKELVKQGYDSGVSEGSRIVHLLRSCLVECERYKCWDSQGQQLLLANLLVGPHEDNRHSNEDLAELILLRLRRIKGAGSELVGFIHAIAQCCGRGTATMDFEYLKILHCSIELASTTREPNGGNLLHETIVDSAFSFAQQKPDRRYLDYATSTEAKFHVVKTKHMSEATPRGSGGFRWEEGISEWVTKTPVPTKIELDNSKDQSEDCDGDTPLRPRQRTVSSSSITDITPLEPRNDAGIEVVISPHPLPSPSMILYDSNSDTSSDIGNSTVNTSVYFSSDECDEGCQTARPDSVTPPRSSRPHARRTFSHGDQTVSLKPRLRRRSQRVKSRGETCQDSDDDEISWLGISSQKEQLPPKVPETRQVSLTRAATQRKSIGSRTRPIKMYDMVSDSEDELCL